MPWEQGPFDALLIDDLGPGRGVETLEQFATRQLGDVAGELALIDGHTLDMAHDLVEETAQAEQLDELVAAADAGIRETIASEQTTGVDELIEPAERVGALLDVAEAGLPVLDVAPPPPPIETPPDETVGDPVTTADQALADARYAAVTDALLSALVRIDALETRTPGALAAAPAPSIAPPAPTQTPAAPAPEPFAQPAAPTQAELEAQAARILAERQAAP